MGTTGLPPLGPTRPLRATWQPETAGLGFLVVLARWAFLVITLMYFVLPSGLLYLMDWHYLGGGAEFEKIHLATYLLIPTLVFLFISDRRFQTRAVAASLDLSFFSFALTIGVIALYATVFKRISVTPFVDTFFSAIMVSIGLTALPRQSVRTLRWMVDVFFITSIALLFYEYLYTVKVLPSPMGETAIIEDVFRANSLFEGSLSAATLVGLYSLVSLIATPIRFSLKCTIRLLLSFVGFAAIFTTGGRTSLIALPVIFSLFLIVSFARQAGTGKFNGPAMIYFIFGIPAFLTMLLILWYNGILDTVLTRFDNDIGSAFSRQFALDLAFNMSADDLWSGMSARDIATFASHQAELGLIAVEISWVNFILVCGWPLTIALFITFSLFLFRFLPKICEGAVVFPGLLLLVSVSASNGIWAKTTILTASVALFIAFLRRDIVET